MEAARYALFHTISPAGLDAHGRRLFHAPDHHTHQGTLIASTRNQVPRAPLTDDIGHKTRKRLQ